MSVPVKLFFPLLLSLACLACSKQTEFQPATSPVDEPQSVSAPPETIPPPNTAEKPSEAPQNDSGVTDKTAMSDVQKPKVETPELKTPTSTDAAPKPVVPARTNLGGRWILLLTQNGTDFKAMLLEFSKSSDAAVPNTDAVAYDVRLVESTRVLPQVSLTTHNVKGQSVHLVFDFQGSGLDFQGSLANGIVRGNVLLGGKRCDPARLIATDVKSLSDKQPFEDTPGLSELRKISESTELLSSVREFCSKNPDSPLALSAYERIFASAKSDHLTEADVAEVADAYYQLARTWGTRMEQFARFKIGIVLAATRFDPAITLKYLDAAEKEASAELRESFRDGIASARNRAQSEQARQMLLATDPDERRKGVEILQGFRKQNPFDYAITFVLAEYAAREKRTDEALALYAELAALPMVERLLMRDWSMEGVQNALPSETVAKLWKKTHGSTDGLDEYLDQVYQERIHSFAEPVREAPAEGSHVMLCELFTGAQCPPCVAADVATGGLEKTYPTSQLVVLRYHQHIPGPDPLANPDTESRFAYYHGPGTPMILLDGTDIAGVGGFISQVAGVYKRLRQPIEATRNKEASPFQITASAVARDGKLHITAEVKSSDDLDDNLRLRLALAEDDVAFIAQNGIRRHEMIVRQMPGGPDGIAPVNGKISYKEPLALGEIKQRLVDYLTGFAQERGVDFPVRPLKLKPMHLVAFLQNDETHEVLQTAMVPVTGALEYPEVKPASKPEQPEPGAADDKTPKSKPIGPTLRPPKTD